MGPLSIFSLFANVCNETWKLYKVDWFTTVTTDNKAATFAPLS